MQARHALALALLVLASRPPGQDPPPRCVVLILADDLGYGDLGCYAAESRIPTPRLDRLAADGLRFTDAHSPSSVCTPTRYGILTGRYAWRTALQRSVLWPWDPPLIERERRTLPEVLRDAGLRTACIGKWHLGWDWPLDAASSVTAEFDGVTWPHDRRAAIAARVDFSRPIGGGPLDHGFDHYFGDDVPNFPPYTFLVDDRVDFLPRVAKPEDMFGWPGPASPGWDLAVVLPRLARRAAAWIDAHAGEPFFLFLPLTAPHTPIAPSPRFAGASRAGAYGDFVAEVDWVVGEVLDALQRNGLADDALVLFTSDNGSPGKDGRNMAGGFRSVESLGHLPSGPWRGAKSEIWEGGHRVPLIARWPGRIPAASAIEELVVLTDLYRTLAHAFGQRVPDDAGEDSFDLWPLLSGPAPGAPVRDHAVHHSVDGMFAIREGRWKLIEGRGSGGVTRVAIRDGDPPGQLYDLVFDPGEQVDRYADRPDVVARLSARLDALRTAGRSAPLDPPVEPHGDADAPPPIPATHATRIVAGFQVHVARDLLATRPDAAGAALEELGDQLRRIRRVLPAPAWERLTRVPIWISARSRTVCMAYHPSRRFLETHDGYDPRMAEAVEIGDVDRFLAWTRRIQPWMVLHELAHAWHHQVLGFDHAGIRAAFERAVADGRWERVRHADGAERRHYALTDPKEWFAEATEAWFGVNDFHPFVRAEFEAFDPPAAPLLRRAWGLD